MYEKSIFTQIIESPLPEERKQLLSSVFKGEQLADLCRDVIAKHVFSPDLHPERMDFILQHTMNQPDIGVRSSATNEVYLQNIYSKKTITDLPAWLRDHRLADLEIQVDPQEFIFTRVDIYASNMLLLQYSVESGQLKSDLDFTNVPGVIIIVLMKESPKVFKEYDSNRYIHRFTRAHSDSGLELPSLKQMVFVQLDKALELYKSQDYNEDEDVELLELFALIADINCDKVTEGSANNRFLNDIREDVYRFTQSKEVQQMIFAEDIARMDYYSSINAARREAAAEGRSEGHADIVDLTKWLMAQGRIDDIKRYTEDPAYLDTLLEEHSKKE